MNILQKEEQYSSYLPYVKWKLDVKPSFFTAKGEYQAYSGWLAQNQMHILYAVKDKWGKSCLPY